MPIRVIVDDIKVEIDSPEEFHAVVHTLFALRKGATRGEHVSVAASTAATPSVPASMPEPTATLMSVPQRTRAECLHEFVRIAKAQKGWPLLQVLHQRGDTPIESAELVASAQVPKEKVGACWTGLVRAAKESGLSLEDVVEKTKRPDNGRYVLSYRLTPEFREVLTKN